MRVNRPHKKTIGTKTCMPKFLLTNQQVLVGAPACRPLKKSQYPPSLLSLKSPSGRLNVYSAGLTIRACADAPTLPLGIVKGSATTVSAVPSTVATSPSGRSTTTSSTMSVALSPVTGSDWATAGTGIATSASVSTSTTDVSRPLISVFSGLELRRAHPRGLEEVAHITQFLLGAGGAVVRTMDDALHPVQHHAKARTVVRLHLGTQVRQHRLHLAPVDIGAYRPSKNGAQQDLVLVAHGRSPRSKNIDSSIGPGQPQRQSMRWGDSLNGACGRAGRARGPTASARG